VGLGLALPSVCHIQSKPVRGSYQSNQEYDCESLHSDLPENNLGVNRCEASSRPIQKNVRPLVVRRRRRVSGAFRAAHPARLVLFSFCDHTLLERL